MTHPHPTDSRTPSHLGRMFASGLVLTAALLLAACGGSTTPEPTAVPPAPATAVAPAEPTAAPAATTAVAPASAPAADAAGLGELWPIAFVRAGSLYIQTGEGAEPLLVEDCSAGACNLAHLTWSPDGTQLLYYVDSYTSGVPRRLRLAAHDGTVQTVTERAAMIQPGGWSPDGRALVYREDTDRYVEATNAPARRVQELYTVAVAEDGTLGTPELRGEVTFGEGCGGGGRSESALAYEREGGFAYGYLAAITRWTPGDILLYTDNCTTRGVNRFDLAANAPLEPYAGMLRSLSLNATGDRWVAVDDQNRIVLGAPDTLETQVLATDLQPEMVFFGQTTGSIYVTTFELAGDRDIFDAVAKLDQSIMLQPFVDMTVPRLYRVDPATGAAVQLYAEEGYAYARVVETSSGSVVFSRVENNDEMVAAIESGQMTAENWRTFLPTVDVLELAPDGGSVVPLLADAHQFTSGGAE